MKKFPENIQFIHAWRPYQARVLKELEQYLDDDKLHLVAPPGSGKTIIGLQVALQLNKPTLILAPSIAIREQWIDRFCTLFLKQNQIPDWISADIKAPAFLTVTTYQGLHSAYTNTQKDEALASFERDTISTDQITWIDSIKEQGFETIVIDEAHHLKNAWWHSLNEVKKILNNPKTVSLTATPPYDSSYQEWERYISLNGEVDTEISIPELLLEKNLAKHQDFLYLSTPTEEELEQVYALEAKRIEHYNVLVEDIYLLDAIKNHKAILNPISNMDWILEHTESYYAYLIYLKHHKVTISSEALELLAKEYEWIPLLESKWMGIVLESYLYKDILHFINCGVHQIALEKKLDRLGFLEGKRIQLNYEERTAQILKNSLSKLSSISEITKKEHTNLGEDLRMVILSDTIQKELLSQQKANTIPLTKIGVIPIFERLRREGITSKIGVLTGSTCIIPVCALNHINDLDSHQIKTLPFDQNFVLISIENNAKKVAKITSLFEDGHIEILVGTQALLGEGWDAPSINTIILASAIGSYVSSNQMRGRAIRINPLVADKVSNIWHLASIQPNTRDGGKEYRMLERRFKAFVGLSSKNTGAIYNDISRINPPENLKNSSNLHDFNLEQFNKSKNRKNTAIEWKDALAKGNIIQHTLQLKSSSEQCNADKKRIQAFKMKEKKNTLRLFISIAILLISSVLLLVQIPFALYLTISSVMLSIYWSIKQILLSKNRKLDPNRIRIAAIAGIIRDCYQQYGFIKTPKGQQNIKVKNEGNGYYTCSLNGVNSHENALFSHAFEEIIQPIENPKYILEINWSTVVAFGKKKYIAIPSLLAKNKIMATEFHSLWSDRIEENTLRYTRNKEGRKLLFQIKVNQYQEESPFRSERMKSWVK